MSTAEKIRLEDHNLHEILDEEFIEGLKNQSENDKSFPIAVVFLNEYTEGDEQDVDLVTISHESQEEIENETVHIESQNPNLVERVKTLFEDNYD